MGKCPTNGVAWTDTRADRDGDGIRAVPRTAAIHVAVSPAPICAA